MARRERGEEVREARKRIITIIIIIIFSQRGRGHVSVVENKRGMTGKKEVILVRKVVW